MSEGFKDDGAVIKSDGLHTGIVYVGSLFGSEDESDVELEEERPSDEPNLGRTTRILRKGVAKQISQSKPNKRLNQQMC